MIKEYQDALDKQTKEQNIKLDNLANNLIKAFEKISKDIQQLEKKVDSKK